MVSDDDMRDPEKDRSSDPTIEVTSAASNAGANDRAEVARETQQRGPIRIDRRQDLVTRPLDPRELAIGPPSWALVTASLERAAPTWGPLAIRLGALALLVECCHAMAQPDAPKALVARAQEILEAINRMHWER